MKVVAWFIMIVFISGILVAACWAAVNDEQDGMGRVELLVSHRYECRSHDCDGDGGSDGNTGYDGEGGRSGDTDQDGDGGNRCRNFCFYGVPLPGGEQPQSLFPPTPDGIRQFVMTTIQAGIEMGRLFADTTITFVSNLLVGIA